MTALTIAQASAALVDPHDCTDAADALAILGALHAALVRRTGPGRYAPALAQGWDAAPGARVWTFTLRDGLRLHDGRPIDAGVAAASIARMARPDVGATLGAPAVWAQYLGGAQVSALDARRLRITLDAPMADLLDVLASAHVLDPDALDDPQVAGVGAGPYALEARGEGFVQLRAASAHPPALRFTAVARAPNRLAALEAGRAQVAVGVPWATPAAPGRTLAPFYAPTLIVFLFNCARPAMADPRVRLALNLAIDRAALARAALAGAAAPQAGALCPAHLGYAPLDPVCDRAQARRLLREAGAGDGLALSIDAPTSLPDEAAALTDALAAQLALVGVDCAVRVWPDRAAYAERVRRSEVGDLCLFDSSPLSTWRVLREKIDSRVKGSWWLGYANARVEALMDAARVELDVDRRAALFRACRDAMRDDPPWLTCYRHGRVTALAGAHPGWAMPDDGVLDVRALP